MHESLLYFFLDSLHLQLHYTGTETDGHEDRHADRKARTQTDIQTNTDCVVSQQFFDSLLGSYRTQCCLVLSTEAESQRKRLNGALEGQGRRGRERKRQGRVRQRERGAGREAMVEEEGRVSRMPLLIARSQFTGHANGILISVGGRRPTQTDR